MSGCSSGGCSGCAASSGCSSQQENTVPKFQLNKSSKVKRVIGVVSGKGGVGKSLVTSLLATNMQKEKFKTAILDADITGPSIPKAFGLSKGDAFGTEEGLIPAKSKLGIDVMSVNLVLENETDPVLWRGPIIAQVVQQFWTDVIWRDVDYMFVDMPPGTGDVALTVFQSLPIDGIILVTSPQDLVSMIVDKAYKMARMMDVPILGMVENMSYFHCPDNDKDYHIFGESQIEEIADEKGVEAISQIPIDPCIAKKVDAGNVEEIDEKWLEPIVNELKKLYE